MTFSSLISGTIPHHGKYNTRPGKVTRVIQHHWASSSNSGIAALGSPSTKKSVNYLVLNNGQILGQVPEEYRPWTSGGPSADNPSITIECQNETNGPEWRVSAAALNSIARLIADIAKRHGFASLNSSTYRGHREFAATACPGPYLWARLQSIRDAANALRSNSTQPAVPATPIAVLDEGVNMLIIASTNRGIALVGPGYYRAIPTMEEVYALKASGVTQHADRITDAEFDYVATACVNGVDNKTSQPVVPAIDLKVLASEIIAQLSNHG